MDANFSNKIFNVPFIRFYFLQTIHGNWADFGRLTDLYFDIVGGAQQCIPNCYANGRHNLEIIITVGIRNLEGNNLTITEEELKSQVFICDSITGENLNTSWTISNESNEYTVKVVTDASMRKYDSLRYVQKFISCSKLNTPDFVQHISVGINIPGIGKFNTSRNGTSTMNCGQGESGSVFDSPKESSIRLVRAIDYGLRENIIVDCGSFVDVQNCDWTSRLTTEGPYKGHDNGICHRRIVRIRPNKIITGEEKFKEFKINFDPVNNGDVNKKSIAWKYGIGVEKEKCFSLLDNNYNMPFAVTGRGHYRDDYQLCLWYPLKSNIKIDGAMFVVDRSYYYRFSAGIRKDHTSDDEKGAVSLLLYKFTMPENYTYQWGWNDCIRQVTIDVTDLLGNEGKLRLIINDDDQFDTPGIM